MRTSVDMRSRADSKLFAPVRGVGRVGVSIARHAGSLGLLLWRILVALFSGRVSPREIFAQAYSMGVQSVPLIVITGMLSGIVTSQQGGYQFTGAIPLYVLGSIVTSSIILELGPVMSAFVVIGRVGARITAEIGTMKVSEQIDALYALGRDPVRSLAAPRLVAGIIVMPVLVAIADAVGLFSGMVAAKLTAGLSHEGFLQGVRIYWRSWDLFYSLAKATAFGFVIPLISAHMGFLTEGGAEGVGRATTSSVVFMILAILVLDAMFPPLLLTR